MDRKRESRPLANEMGPDEEIGVILSAQGGTILHLQLRPEGRACPRDLGVDVDEKSVGGTAEARRTPTMGVDCWYRSLLFAAPCKDGRHRVEYTRSARGGRRRRGGRR